MRFVRCGEGAGERGVPSNLGSLFGFLIHWCLMAKEQRFCIFCGRSGLSREHIWSEWTYQYAPKEPNVTHIKYAEVSTPGNASRREKSYQGDVNTIKLRVVCERHCNNGWMSALEQRAKPLLIPLLRGEPAVLSKNTQSVLAAWAATKVMVCEHYDPDSITSTQEDRNFLMTNQTPPTFWRIWFANQTGGPEWRSAYSRYAAELGPVPNGEPSPVMGKIPKNTQAVTLGIGKLLIHAIACSLPNVVFDLPDSYTRYLHRIWPYQGDFFWPPQPALQAREAEFIARSMRRYAQTLKWFKTEVG